MLSPEYKPLTPLAYFGISLDCHYLENVQSPCAMPSRYRLPDLAVLSGEEPFADVSFGWNNSALAAQVTVKKPFVQSFYPGVTRGDSVELFIDTRDVKTSGWNTKFCHHFFFLPEAVEGHSAGEITAFRTEDKHDLCDCNALQVKSVLKRREYSMYILIPASCLHGYDPEQFKRLGFSYRINRLGGPPQHFSVTSKDYPIEQQPSQWSSVQLSSKK